MIRAKCARMLGDGDDAADVAQETFVRLCESGFVHREPAVRATWIYRTSTRIAADRLRRRRAGVETRAGDDAPDGAPGADDTLHARRALAALAGAAPRDELAVAILCRVDGLTQPEAAEVLDVSERTVRRRLDRFDARVAELHGRAR